MKKSLLGFLISFLLAAAAACSQAPVETADTPSPTPSPAPSPTTEPVAETAGEGWELVSQEAGEGWELVWQDEFAGEELDRNNWTFDLGAGGWGNNELQYYTDRPENVRVEEGFLVIEAVEEDYRGSNYTSARIKTQGLHDWAYGRFEARMKLPTGKGVWSAFWMLGSDINSVGWPRSGEIDIMENIGDPNAIGGALHGPGYSGGENIGRLYVTSVLSVEDFHLYAIEWRPGEISWFVDDVLYNRTTFDEVPGPWVYDHPFFIILNLAIGGTYPGNPDETTLFPKQVLVDYVRVYREPNLVIEEKPEAHVAEIQIDLEQVDGRHEVSKSVVVIDQDGNPVEGAIVEAGWLGVVAGADSGWVTDENGKAGPFRAVQAPYASEVSFCVVNVSHALYTYNKSANIQTCLFVEPDAP